MQCTSTWFSVCHSVLFTVRETRAPMGTKATPTVSLSIIMSVGIHNVDARLPWCQLLRFKQAGRPYIFNWHPSQKRRKKKDTRTTSWLYHVWSLWIGASGHRTRSVISRRLPTRLDEVMNIYLWWAFFVLEGRGPKGKPEGERRWDGLAETLWWWSWHPWKAQRSESLHVELHDRWENLTLLSVWEWPLWVLFCNSSGTKVSLLCWNDPVLCEWLWLDVTLCASDVIGL